MRFWTSIHNNKKKLIFISVLFFSGIVIGLFIFCNQSSSMKEIINSELETFRALITNSRVNQIYYHFLILGILFLLNFTVIGFLGSILYIFYEGCSIGFSIAMFTYKYKVSGLIFGLIFNLVTKTFFILLLIYICYMGIIIMKKIIGSVVLKQNNITHLFIKRSFIILLIILLLSIISDLILYTIGSKVLKFFLFLL